MSECEHELNLVDENWIDENRVRLAAKCDLWKRKFEGLLVEDID